MSAVNRIARPKSPLPVIQPEMPPALYPAPGPGHNCGSNGHCRSSGPYASPAAVLQAGVVPPPPVIVPPPAGLPPPVVVPPPPIAAVLLHSYSYLTIPFSLNLLHLAPTVLQLPPGVISDEQLLYELWRDENIMLKAIHLGFADELTVPPVLPVLPVLPPPAGVPPPVVVPPPPAEHMQR